MPANATAIITSKVLAQTIDLMRIAEGLRAQILSDLETLETDLIRDLQDVTGKTQFTVERLRALLVQTRQTIGTAYGEIALSFPAELKSIALAISEQILTTVNTALRVDLLSVAMSKEQLEYIAGKTVIEGHFPAQFWKKQGQVLRDRFAATMRQGQYRGETVDQLVRRVRGTKANNFTDGVMNASRRHAEALVRTGVQGVANEAKLKNYINNRDVVRAIQWVAMLEDTRACEACRELNGRIWRLPETGDKDADYIPEGHKTPFPGVIKHFNCRCVQVPITFSFKELAARNRGE